ncbi:MAG: protease modulator HflC [Phycisphaerae bacterium]
MMKHIGVVAIAALVLIGLGVYTFTYKTYEPRDIDIVTRFGEVQEINAGAEGAGLHAKWPYPFEQVTEYDARIHILESPHMEVTTNDKRNLLVTAFCTWKIGQPEKFYSKIKYVDQAEDRLRTQLKGQVQGVVARHRLGELVNTDPEKMMLGDMEEQMVSGYTDSDGKQVPGLKQTMSEDYGIDVIMIGIKSVGLPQQISQAVIDSMIAERNKEAEKYRARGDTQLITIKNRADAARDQILAFADRKGREIRARADLEAAQYYQEFRGNEELAMYLRYLETLRKLKNGSTTMVMDGTAIPAVRWFSEGPSLPAGPPVPTTGDAAPIEATDATD